MTGETCIFIQVYQEEKFEFNDEKDKMNKEFTDVVSEVKVKTILNEDN